MTPKTRVEARPPRALKPLNIEAKRQNLPKRTLILVRHGQYVRADELTGQKEVLTALGRKQAALAGKRLREQPRIDRLVYSTLPRADETARIIARELGRRRREACKGLWECRPQVSKQYEKRSPEILKLDGAMAFSAEATRYAERAFKKYFRKAGRKSTTEILVCHGNIIRYLFLRALQVDPSHWAHLDIKQCGITTIEIDSRGWMRVIAHNDLGHIPLGMQTFI